MSQDKQLGGRVALITGATSGIGAATARAFASAGASLALVGRNADRARQMEDELRDTGADTLCMLGDVADSGFCDSTVEAVVQKFGALDILANIAGVIRRGDATQTTDEDWRANMATNVDGTFFMSRAAVRAMRETGGGAIINLASTVGLVGARNLPAYCASKGAVVNLTRAMALDHAAEGIRINAVCPGAVDTPLLVSEHHRTGLTPDQVHERNTASIPQKRIPSPNEIASVIVFLATNAASHVTGAALPVDGGYTAE